MSRVVAYAGLSFKGGYTVNTCRIVCRNIAGLLYAMLDLRNEAATYKGGIVRAAARHGLITEKPREVTAKGHEWLTAYKGDIALLEEVLRPVPMPTYTRKDRAAKGITPKARPAVRAKPPTPAPAPSTVARDLITAGLIFVHPALIDALSADELSLWLKAKRHERTGVTLAQLAAMLGEPLEATRIRAERCAERGYPLTVRQTEDAA